MPVADSLLALRVEIDPTHSAFDLVKTNVVESFEAGSLDALQLIVGHQEMLLPPHKNALLLPPVFVVQWVYKVDVALSLQAKRSPGRKPRPMCKVSLITGAPGWIPSPEAVFLIRPSYNLSSKESRQCRVVWS